MIPSRFAEKAVLMALLVSGASGRAVSWDGHFRLIQHLGPAFASYCDSRMRVELSKNKDGIAILSLDGISGPEMSYVIEALPVKITKAHDNWFYGRIPTYKVSGEVGEFYARQGRSYFKGDFFPLYANHEVKANLSKDGRRITIRRYDTLLGLGTRVRCTYERLEFP